MNEKVIRAIWKKSNGGINRCHLICQFIEGGNPVEHTIHVGQVCLGHNEIDPYTNPLYHPSATPSPSAAAAAAAAAAAIIAPYQEYQTHHWKQK